MGLINIWRAVVLAGLSGGAIAPAAAAPRPDSLLAVVRTTRSPPQRAQALIQLSEYFRTTDSTRAYGYARQAVTVAHAQADTLETHALLALGLVYQAHGHYPVAEAYFRQALALAQRQGLLREVAQSYRTLSIYHKQLGHFAQAWAAARQELPLRQQLRDTVKLIGLFNNMASLCRGQGDYLAALTNYLDAEELAQRLHRPAEQAVILSNIGGLYQGQNDYPPALRYLRRASALHRALRDTALLAADYAALGELYTLSRNYPEARRYLRESQRQATALGARLDPSEQARLLANFGYLEAQLGHPLPALGYYRRATALYRPNQEPHERATLLAWRVEAYQASGQFAAARRGARELLALARTSSGRFNMVAALLVLANLHAATHDYGRAYRYRLQYEAAYDSLLNEKKNRQLTALQARYEVRDKNAQITQLHHRDGQLRREARLQQRLGAALGGGLLLASLLGFSWYRRYRAQRTANGLLRARDAEIAATNGALLGTQGHLRQSLAEKDVLLKEVHHRVKNNLQIIASLFALQAFEQPHVPALAAALQEGQNRIQTIALIHELLYQSADLTRIDFQQFLHQLAAYLADAFGQPVRRPVPPAGVLLAAGAHFEAAPAVVVEVRAEGVRLRAATAVPLGLVVNELLSNAYQHAFPDGRAGLVEVHIAPADVPGRFTLTVTDDGAGLPRHFTLAQASSLGLRLVGNLARQLHGTFEAVRGTPGACFRITFQETDDEMAGAVVV